MNLLDPRESLNASYKMVHVNQSRACDQGCIMGHVFSNEQRYRDRRYNYHPTAPTFVSQQSQLRDVCSHKKEFTASIQYR